MAIYNTRKLVEELYAVLNANVDTDFVSTDALEPLASESNQRAVYIGVEEIALQPARMQTASGGYDRHMLVNLYCNYDGTDDSLGIYDFIDSIEKSVLTDTEIWSSLVDREIVAIDFDSQEHSPKRSVTMLFDITYRILCE